MIASLLFDLHDVLNFEMLGPTTSGADYLHFNRKARPDPGLVEIRPMDRLDGASIALELPALRHRDVLLSRSFVTIAGTKTASPVVSIHERSTAEQLTAIVKEVVATG